MCTVFYDLTVLEYKDTVTEVCAGKSMGDKQSGFVLGSFVKTFVDIMFGAGISGSSEFIEN